jgi:hypothetical protein
LLGLVAAAALPFLVLIGVGLWNQTRTQQAEALNRALGDARILAAQVDDHLGNVEKLMVGLGHAVSTNPADAAANDAQLRSLKTELPDFIADITVATPDGENIGSASGQRLPRRRPPLFRPGPGGRTGGGRRSPAQPGDWPLGVSGRARHQEFGG